MPYHSRKIRVHMPSSVPISMAAYHFQSSSSPFILLIQTLQTPSSNSNMRKLLTATASSPISQSGILSNTSSALIKTQNNEEKDYYVSSSYGGFSGYRINPPFDASMALTILVLLIALFFMAFFSVYIRRFSVENSSSRRRYSTSLKGVDPFTLNSLPIYSYSGESKQEMECTICLSEFEEDEVVKVIPFCGHVFHIECIDTWLDSHVTCPLCRTAKLFPKEEVRVAIGCDAGAVDMVGEVGLTADGRDTWMEDVGPGGMRRSRSCLVSCERVVLCRSFSF